MIVFETLGFDLNMFEFDCDTLSTVFHVLPTSHSTFPTHFLKKHYVLEVYYFTFKVVQFDEIFKVILFQSVIQWFLKRIITVFRSIID